MPKRTDIKSILIIGSGPIVIGQACEFDYSGTQACKALREEGYRIILVNSNPATIMTDPQFSDRTYIEPVTPEAVIKVIEKERPDALLPTLGGQTGLNVAVQVADSGALEKYGVQMIGATREAIHRAEDRKQFKETMIHAGLQLPRSGLAYNMEQARALLAEIGLPAIIRPSFTLGGTGSGIAYNRDEFEEIAARGLEYSMINEILVEESVIGWKEFEMEVMRDHKDNVVIICAIENFDPMGVHTGDSITVAPAQTLTDKEYQLMRDASIKCIRAIGVETGGSNIQFAINPDDGRMVIIEMNPRVSRSSALASKATGFPIAKIAAKLAVGYTLDEIPNDITRETPACFEPTIDYCVVKIPRWTFEKFPDADETLTTQMKSVGEAMSIGRTFKEALQKGLRSMEVKRFGLGLDNFDKWLKELRRKKRPTAETAAPALGGDPHNVAHTEQAATTFPIPEERLLRKLIVPSQGRLYYVRYALKMGYTVEQVHQHTNIDPWFLTQIKQLVDFEGELAAVKSLADAPADLLAQAKQWGYSDVQLATIWGSKPLDVRRRRTELGIVPTYKLVDTCAAEFEAYTPYYYSSYEAPYVTVQGSGVGGQGSAGKSSLPQSPTPDPRPLAFDDEIRVSDKKKIVILGGGPNRIGQGIEFDYCCVHAVQACRELGFETVMVNSNPETVSTDYDTSDLLFFEPLTQEDVLNICERLNGKPLNSSRDGGLLFGVIVQFGGQTPLNLARGLADAGVPIIGTSPESIAQAEDRELFNTLLDKLDIAQPPGAIVFDLVGAKAAARKLGYPVLVRPSFVLGGRAMEIVYDDEALEHYMTFAVEASEEHPVLIDKFLDQAIEMDVDAIADREGNVIVAGLMEHIEEAGIHSGDSACALPPYSLPPRVVQKVKEQTIKLAKALNVIGLINVQYAIRGEKIYVLEANPRASRTVPFVSKATGVPWAKLAAKVMTGMTLPELGAAEPPALKHTAVKESVFPFAKFPGVDVILGPEMRSTGEVMGLDSDFAMAFAKSQFGAGLKLPTSGKVFVSVRDSDKPQVAAIAAKLAESGLEILSTRGTAAVLQAAGVPVTIINKISEGRPNVLDLVKNFEIVLIVNTPTRKGRNTDEGKLRATAVIHNIPLVTTITGARAAARAIAALKAKPEGFTVKPLQDYFTSV
ncbi:MAG: Carbamoyl-phosphate synthase large chain [Phycisphaerae bacterium]|nr:Carbamoyl-phosphate synthase large chain [Phycisphaerae bacterium]